MTFDPFKDFESLHNFISFFRILNEGFINLIGAGFTNTNYRKLSKKEKQNN